MTSDFSDFVIDMTYNTSSKAGEVIYYTGGHVLYDVAWLGNGSGTWKLYNTDDGSLEDSGSWS